MKFWRPVLFVLIVLILGPIGPSHHSPEAQARGVNAPRKSKRTRSKPRTRKIRRTKIKHTVRKGDTLGGIAKQYGVSVGQIRGWNPKIRGNNVRVGQTIVVWTRASGGSGGRSRRSKSHVVKKGETAAQIAKKYKVSVRDLKAWNPRMKPAKLRVGSKLTVYVWGPAREDNSSSAGTANSGKLKNGVALQSGHGFRVRNTQRSFGTVTAVDYIDQCISATKDKYPNAHDLLIGDISFKNGGHMPPHKSHQSGRDADISYYIKNVQNPYRFNVASAKTLDVPKTWYLFEKFLATGQVTYIFVDYPLQEVLYKHAKKLGKKQDYLNRVFQYPRGRGSSQGIIRYSRGHDDHFHIRFSCNKKDSKCR